MVTTASLASLILLPKNGEWIYLTRAGKRVPGVPGEHTPPCWCMHKTYYKFVFACTAFRFYAGVALPACTTLIVLYPN